VLGLRGTAGNAISAGRSIAIDPQGRFFFDGWGTTLGTIDSALISPADGTALTGITSVTSANEIPAAMLADSSGKFLYVEQGSAPVVYAINQTTGALAVPPAALAVLSFSPHSAVADPLGPYIYSLQNDGVHGFLVDPQSGKLSEIPGSPFGGTAAQGALAISGTPVQAVSGPVAAIFPASEDFGPVTVGQSSSSKLVTLTNTGGQSLSLSSVGVAGANPSDFVATPNCSFPMVLAPNATCSISVVFSPRAAGTRQASLAATDNAPGSPQSIPLSGTGASPLPAVTLTPGSLTFASTTQGSTSPAQSVTVTNSGAATLHISSVLPGGSNPADFQVTNACSGAYPVSSTCSITVTFSPLGAGQRTANLTITDDAPDSPQSVQLTGTGAALPPGTPIARLTPSSISFGTVTQGSAVAAQVVTLSSSGTGPLHITSVATGGRNASDFSLTNNCTAPTYAVGATCTIGVSLSPLATGARAAFITITDDAPNSPQAINLSATVTAALTITPAAAGSTSVTVTAGQAATFNLLLTPGPGFTGGASFACAGAACGCHLHGTQRAIGRRNSPLLCCDCGHDGEHHDHASAATPAAPSIYLVTRVFFAGGLRGFCAASLCFQVAALELKRGLAARRSASRPCITFCFRGCGMCWRRSKRKPAGCSHAACDRHTAGDVDHHRDPVSYNVNRHSSARHPAGSTHAHRAVAFGMCRIAGR